MLKMMKKETIIPVGIWLNANCFELVWFCPKNQPHFCQIKSEQKDEIYPILLRNIAEHFPMQKIKLQFITAIPPHKIWMKTLILQQALSDVEYEQQCRYILEKSLPTPLDELWFDYTATSLKQNTRLDIFAVMERIAQKHIATFSPVQIDVLTPVQHCLSKAFSYFTGGLSPTTLYLYQEQQFSLAFRHTPQEWQLCAETSGNLTALFQQFTARYGGNGESGDNITIYSSNPNAIKFEQKFQQIQTDAPFIALGLALWQRELFQDEKYD